MGWIIWWFEEYISTDNDNKWNSRVVFFFCISHSRIFVISLSLLNPNRKIRTFFLGLKRRMQFLRVCYLLPSIHTRTHFQPNTFIFIIVSNYNLTLVNVLLYKRLVFPHQIVFTITFWWLSLLRNVLILLLCYDYCHNALLLIIVLKTISITMQTKNYF